MPHAKKLHSYFKITKNMYYRIVFFIIIGLIVSSFSMKPQPCNTTEIPVIHLIFNDPNYKSKYPLKNISISILNRDFGRDSIEKVILRDTSSFNQLHSIDIRNSINKNSVIKLAFHNKEYVFSDFEIREVKIETMFWRSYQTCIIDGCKVNGKYINQSKNPFEIITDL